MLPDEFNDRSEPVASVVITTRNRAKETLSAVASAFAQDVPVEVLVYDDASTDGTIDSVRSEFPAARVFAHHQRLGYIHHRNSGFVDARTSFVFSIDDDAFFSATDIVRKSLMSFESDPKIAAVAIPFIEPLARRSLSNLADPMRAKAGESVRSYIGCAHVIRKEVALACGSYREFFVHQGEEVDLCARLWAKGYKVVYGDSAPIVHMVSPNRDTHRVQKYGVRNQIHFLVFNAPLAVLPWAICKRAIGLIRYRFQWRTLGAKIFNLIVGLLSGCLHSFRQRNAMTLEQWRHFRLLPGHGPYHWDGPVPKPCHRLAAH